MEKRCHRCGTVWEGFAQPGRSQTCTSCTADLRCCKNCELYDVSRSSHCKSHTTDPPGDKERANYCDEFVFARNAYKGSPPSTPPAPAKDKARKKFDDLFNF